jgi:hypothetical protein
MLDRNAFPEEAFDKDGNPVTLNDFLDKTGFDAIFKERKAESDKQNDGSRNIKKQEKLQRGTLLYHSPQNNTIIKN